MRAPALLVLFATGCYGVTEIAPAEAPPAAPAARMPEAAPPDEVFVSAGASLDLHNVFEHANLQADPFVVLSRIREQGPPEISTRLHSCQKPKLATLEGILAGLGVDLSRDTPGSAGKLLRDGRAALGAPNYRARIPEAIEWTTSGATKAFDVFVQAAPEIIAAMPSNPRCALAGKPTAMFDEAGKCTIAGIACLQGLRATQTQKELCDAAVAAGSTPEIGRVIAVASVLAAAHTCE